MKLPFFNSALVRKLREGAEDNQSKYGDDTSWLDDFVGSNPLNHESRHVVDPPPALLLPDDDGLHDAENSKLIYNWLKDLSPSTAMEERLWACLTHTMFPEYMAKRWPANSPSAISRRYLLEGQTFAGLARNGVSRLWWAGYLTEDKSRSNPFELTGVLFLRQDIQVALLERRIGKCRNLRYTVLDFFLKNKGWLEDHSFGDRIKAIVKELNLLGGVVVLDDLKTDEIEEYLNRIAQMIVNGSEDDTNQAESVVA